ncbi:hypothetical protein HD554DRAFT_2288156 [Boletus coccyginus]|nr:hypothetical protein HD554DRAFT_2288156 [Boletus coccyginus]
METFVADEAGTKDTRLTKDAAVEHPSGNRLAKKRRRGKAGEICQLNLDVLFLIATYIHPIDLLNLARTCKSLRQLLMDKSSTFVWKTARRQVDDLPDCPADLTEPEYANLVFYARCHGCGKYARTILWEMRRRYCPDCRTERLCPLLSVPWAIQKILPQELITIGRDTRIWVDKEQMESLMHEYNHSSDQTQFLKDKVEHHAAICKHARQCEKWQQSNEWDRKIALDKRRGERNDSIFERLKQLGYDPEVTYFGRRKIKLSCKPLFRKSKPLTDKEWDQIWPEWLETMNDFRSQRLEEVVYQSRRALFASEYAKYVMSPPPNIPAFDLLPHVAEVACLPPFREIIRAPEGTKMGDKPFESAFSQLPELVDEWRKNLDIEVAELVEIPPHLSFKGTPDGGIVASGSTRGSESSRAPTNKLRLACALFQGSFKGVFAHPDVFSASMCNSTYPYSMGKGDVERTGSLGHRYGIKYMAEAPYVIHACGLDPNVATADDMDRRDARLKCLSCQSSRVRRWRDAVGVPLYA